MGGGDEADTSNQSSEMALYKASMVYFDYDDQYLQEENRQRIARRIGTVRVMYRFLIDSQPRIGSSPMRIAVRIDRESHQNRRESPTLTSLL